MQAVVGVFKAQTGAKCAVERLHAVLPDDRINLLLPQAPAPAPAETAVPKDEDMAPVGKVIGGALGGALGTAAGAGFFLPALVFAGTNPFVATGVIVASAVSGFLGASAGASVGKAFDNKSTEGVPIDHLYVYRDALSQGRTVIVANVETESQSDAARRIFTECGAESIDAGQKSWEVGMVSDEELEYHAEEAKR